MNLCGLIYSAILGAESEVVPSLHPAQVVHELVDVLNAKLRSVGIGTHIAVRSSPRITIRLGKASSPGNDELPTRDRSFVVAVKAETDFVAHVGAEVVILAQGDEPVNAAEGRSRTSGSMPQCRCRCLRHKRNAPGTGPLSEIFQSKEFSGGQVVVVVAGPEKPMSPIGILTAYWLEGCYRRPAAARDAANLEAAAGTPPAGTYFWNCCKLVLLTEHVCASIVYPAAVGRTCGNRRRLRCRSGCTPSW